MTSLRVLIPGLLVPAVLILGGCDGESTAPQPLGPQMGVSTDTLDFSVTGVERPLVIYNTGGETLEWSVFSQPPWIDAEPVFGVLGQDQEDTVWVTVDRTALPAGLNSGVIELRSNADTLLVTTLAQVVEGPVLGELQLTLNFGGSADSLALTIPNAGTDTLTWSLQIAGPYFSVAPDSGETPPGAASTVWVRFDRDTAPVGQQTAVLTVNSNGGTGQVLLQAQVGTDMWLSHFDQADAIYQPAPSDYFFIVRFDRPEGWQDFKVSRVSLLLYSVPSANDAIVLIAWDVTEDFGQVFPDLENELHSTGYLNPENGWNEWSVNWPLSVDTFCVGYFQQSVDPVPLPQPWYDLTSDWGHSYRSRALPSGFLSTELQVNVEWCLEIFVEPLFTAAGSAPAGRWLRPVKVIPEAGWDLSPAAGPARLTPLEGGQRR
ncbi:MAG: hypothetical protein C4524_12065 [Candidatus Zixiibacteriota bacterium]|nr:MAG: hypothetical protein C4524_12065 [candidate division Zixibacteria bacterium]